ncbi:MAG: disulfide bond formation protein B [Alphaproteobacteria bacterium]|nr:disulfide bond formation protein B [Alphaproteobacteria bacterium]MDE1985480.1 disulfide bond formation protein B [Alphaproteobacteria bacterium]MDE2161573.1 disulfide bond formation protein B [Alphaproteobacteria bacterium]MDE2264622.1 disulfide bond formation protein B [Alphaproteobacteria bacterium]MDE2498810.1 disulfide bond formation protein B [Alphaproteobacteria bacterium]
MSAQNIAALAGAYSLAMILGALGFQYIGGVVPCEMCHWQRWPLDAAILIGFGGAILFASGLIGRKMTVAMAWLALILIAVTGLIGAYQAGVEWKLLPGPASCTGDRFIATSMTDLSHVAPVVRCDVAAWRLFGISLAGYNAIFSLGVSLLGGYLLASRKPFFLTRRKA